MNLTKNKFILYSAIVAFLGLLDASYLTIEHFKNVIPPCTLKGCDVVLTSHFSTIFGVPLSLFGMGFYLSVILMSLLLITNPKPLFLKLFYLLAGWGFVFSLFLLAIQAFVLHQFCQYCLLSCATSTGIFLLAALNFWKDKKSKNEDETN